MVMQRIRLIICLLLVGVALNVVNYSALTKESTPVTGRQTVVAASGMGRPAAQTATTEGCITCHGQIEPMHKYGPTEVYETLKDGKDAVGLSCTGCHGGNPAARKTGNDANSVFSQIAGDHFRGVLAVGRTAARADNCDAGTFQTLAPISFYI